MDHAKTTISIQDAVILRCLETADMLAQDCLSIQTCKESSVYATVSQFTDVVPDSADMYIKNKSQATVEQAFTCGLGTEKESVSSIDTSKASPPGQNNKAASDITCNLPAAARKEHVPASLNQIDESGSNNAGFRESEPGILALNESPQMDICLTFHKSSCNPECHTWSENIQKLDSKCTAAAKEGLISSAQKPLFECLSIGSAAVVPDPVSQSCNINCFQQPGLSLCELSENKGVMPAVEVQGIIHTSPSDDDAFLLKSRQADEPEQLIGSTDANVFKTGTMRPDDVHPARLQDCVKEPQEQMSVEMHVSSPSYNPELTDTAVPIAAEPKISIAVTSFSDTLCAAESVDLTKRQTSHLAMSPEISKELKHCDPCLISTCQHCPTTRSSLPKPDDLLSLIRAEQLQPCLLPNPDPGIHNCNSGKPAVKGDLTTGAQCISISSSRECEIQVKGIFAESLNLESNMPVLTSDPPSPTKADNGHLDSSFTQKIATPVHHPYPLQCSMAEQLSSEGEVHLTGSQGCKLSVIPHEQVARDRRKDANMIRTLELQLHPASIGQHCNTNTQIKSSESLRLNANHNLVRSHSGYEEMAQKLGLFDQIQTASVEQEAHTECLLPKNDSLCTLRSNTVDFVQPSSDKSKFDNLQRVAPYQTITSQEMHVTHHPSQGGQVSHDKLPSMRSSNDHPQIPFLKSPALIEARQKSEAVKQADRAVMRSLDNSLSSESSCTKRAKLMPTGCKVLLLEAMDGQHSKTDQAVISIQGSYLLEPDEPLHNDEQEVHLVQGTKNALAMPFRGAKSPDSMKGGRLTWSEGLQESHELTEAKTVAGRPLFAQYLVPGLRKPKGPNHKPLHPGARYNRDRN
ncbi:hypothetical protein CEUSTIGMA_g5615.t1 [Chlamydomonas eustigma]|uniref:Uncharacterized protein n=1 Tax=Chlamydomonas eustigma TaxID=1157962 RepID=A0A250X523_9CHLO|nr:hypothetical protein CEUSTIGMA_g5615.t1 [Chlamydomonas eustigma]|eukprot:GAX78173.1 hypothetical protein CEUSTIGMA_g5615.t1 [Chlamydomonas eustigma]